MQSIQEKVIACAQNGAKKYAAQELEYIKRFAAIDSPSRDEDASKDTVAVVEEMLQKIEGIEIERVYAPGYGYHVEARLKPENANGKIILNGHTDTVFRRGDTAAHPYREDGDKAYGLGIADCKGGLIVAIYSVLVMQEAGLLLNKEILFIFNCDEEIGSPSGRKVFEEHLAGTQMAFIFEPSREDNGVLTQRKGWVHIKMDLTGKKAHTGVNYLEGRSAVTEAAYLIKRLYESCDSERGIYFNAGQIKNDDPMNIVSGHATVEFSARIADNADLEYVNQTVAKIESEPPYIEGVERKFEIEPHYPMERSEGNVALYHKVRSVGRLLGYELPEQKSSGSGDGSFFTFNGIPTIDGLGAYMYQIHSFDESMRISSLEEKTCLFASVLGLLDHMKEGN